jgi:hypothetical protein
MASRWTRIVRPRAEYEKRLLARRPYTESCGRSKAERIFILLPPVEAVASASVAPVGSVLEVVSCARV